MSKTPKFVAHDQSTQPPDNTSDLCVMWPWRGGVVIKRWTCNRHKLSVRRGHRHSTANALSALVCQKEKRFQRAWKLSVPMSGSRKLSERELQIDGPATDKARRFNPSECWCNYSATPLFGPRGSPMLEPPPPLPKCFRTVHYHAGKKKFVRSYKPLNPVRLIIKHT